MGDLSTENFSYVVTASDHTHQQITPSNHVFETNRKESSKVVSVPNIPHSLPNLWDWDDMIIKPV